MPNLSDNEKRLVMIASVILFIFFFYTFTILPSGRAYVDLNDKILKAEIELRKSKRVLSEKEIVEGEFSKYRELIKLAASDDEETAMLINEIEKLSKESDIHISNLSPRSTEDKGVYKKYSIEIKIISEIKPFIDFLSRLTRSTQMPGVEKLRVNSRVREPGKLEINLTISKIRLP